MSDTNHITSATQIEPLPDSAVAAHWIIVTQVKSHRVVYFTDDPQYQPPMEGDWYYCCPYGGLLPEGMTLRNCWGWRFNGGVFADARATPVKPAHETLMDSNRKALMSLLREKIDTIREPYLPSCQQGDFIRHLKLSEAQSYLAGKGEAYPYLQTVAAARNISLAEAARLILAKAEETKQVLLQSERFRELLAQSIQSAQNQVQLLQVRTWLLDQVYPELSKDFKFHIDNTEPLDLNKAIGQTHRQHEITRLKAQLRELINVQRADIDSNYVQNDELRKHKAQLARAVLNNGGKAPHGLDMTLLENYAQTRQLGLAEAAELIVNSMAQSAEVLTRTELLKDSLLARIEAITTLVDVRAIAAELEALERI
jgi:hypothetical protein